MNFGDMVEIKDISGKTRFSTPINKGAKGKFTLMKEDYIILPFSVQKPVYFKLGDYVDLSGIIDDSLGGLMSKKYEIVDLQKPVYNTSTGGYDYQLRLDAYYWKWKNKIFKYTPEQAGREASWSLTATLDVQLEVFLRNLKALGYNFNGKDFEFSIDSTVENKAVAMTYDNINLLDALFSMAGEDKWNCDCWITDNIIHFGRNEFGDAVKIERGAEAVSITRSESQGTYATRVYAFGSTKNIPSNYRSTDEQAVVNGVVQKRLMLPVDTPYIDAYEGMTTEEAIEDVVVFDDVFPRRVGTLSDVHTRTEEVENEDGTTETVTYYRFKDTGLEFKEEYIIEGQELRIQFQSGKLNGMEFGVIFNPEPKDESRGEQLWEIVRNEDYGRPLPDDIIRPENGDEYILSGFDIQLVSDQYIPAAERELKEKALKYAEIAKKDDGTYPTTLRSSWVKENLISRTFEFGQRINLVDDTYFENGRISRVLGWELNLDIPWDSPVYTIGESMPYSRIQEIEDKVDALTYKGQTYTGGGGSGVYIIRKNDSTAPSDSNVFSALRSLSMFLRKDQEDKTDFLLRLLGGLVTTDIKSDDFLPGALGTGYGLLKKDSTGKSYFEVDKLFVRLKAIFAELEVMELTYSGGNFIFGPAGARCTKVEEYDDYYRCYFTADDGSKKVNNKFRVDDQVQCRESNIEEGVHENVSNKYYWRLCVGVGDDYIDLSKSIRDMASDDPPAEGDSMVTVGNQKDVSRQNVIIISVYGEGSPSITRYQGINSFSMEGKAIKTEYYDATTGRYKEITYGDNYNGAPDRTSFFEYIDGEGLKVRGAVDVQPGSVGWKNFTGLSDSIQVAVDAAGNALDKANQAQTDAEDAKQDAEDAKQDAADAAGRLDQWASDSAISPTEKLALKQELANLQSEYDTNIANAGKYGLSTTAYANAWNAYKTELEYHSADSPESIPIRDSFKTSQATFYTERETLLTAIAAAAKEYADKLLDSLAVGAENLLLNTGFTGNYKVATLSASTKLTANTQLYSDKLEHWTGTGTVIADTNSVSGQACSIGSLAQSVTLIVGESYVISYKAKGTTVTVSCGAYSGTDALTSSYKVYTHKFKYQGGGIFMVSGTATICEIKLERGTVRTDWCPSRKDTNPVADSFKHLWYLQDALQGNTQIIGGLTLTSIIMLGQFADGILKKVNAGISGIWNNDQDVAYWAGGTFEQAIATIQKIVVLGENPTDTEWKNLAKFVATHGGDIVLKGIIYATGGVFNGTIYAKDGLFEGIVKAKAVYTQVTDITDMENVTIDPDVDGNYFVGEGHLNETLKPVVTLNMPLAKDWPWLNLKVRSQRIARQGTGIILKCSSTNKFLISSLSGSYSMCCCLDGLLASFVSNGTNWIVENANNCTYSNDLNTWYDYQGNKVTVDGTTIVENTEISNE